MGLNSYTNRYLSKNRSSYIVNLLLFTLCALKGACGLGLTIFYFDQSLFHKYNIIEVGSDSKG